MPIGALEIRLSNLHSPFHPASLSLWRDGERASGKVDFGEVGLNREEEVVDLAGALGRLVAPLGAPA